MRLASNRDKKPEALWIGSNVGKNEELLTHTHTHTHTHTQIKWPEYKSRSLFFWISTDPTGILKTGTNKKRSKLLGVPTAIC